MKPTDVMRNDGWARDLAHTESVRGALAGLALTMLLSSLGTSIANVGLPTLVQVFNASFQDVQWVVIAYLLAITCLIVSVGRLGDLMGRRRLMLAGLCLFSVASVFCGLAPTLWWLVAARALQGLGAAIMMALTMALVGETVPKDKTGSAMGLLGTMSAIGTALGPSLGGFLIAALGWRSMFVINLPLGLLALLFAWRYLPADHAFVPRDKASFDYAGTLLLTLTLAAYALAATLGQGHFGLRNLMLLLLAALGIGLFVIVEARVESPLVRLAIFRNSQLSTGFATSALVATVMMATLVVGPFYLAGVLGLDPARVGLVMSCGPIFSALAGVPFGRIVDRFGSHRMASLGLMGMLTGCTILAVMPVGFGIPGYLAPLILVTAGYALFQVANNTAVMANIGADQRGLVSAILNLSRNLGLTSGASVMGAVFIVGSGAVVTASHSESVAAGMHATFAVAAALMSAALTMAIYSVLRPVPHATH